VAAYRYKALNQKGKTVSGSVQAASMEGAIAQLRHDRLLPIAVTAAGHSPLEAWSITARLRRGAARAQLPQAIRELATFLQAGLPLDRALAMLAELTDFKPIAGHLIGIRDRVRTGASMADAMAADPLIPHIVVSLARAGEAGGSLASTLSSLADYLLRAQAIREAVVSAMIYPTLLICTGIASTLVIILFVLPQFEPLFQSSGKDIPAMLSLLLGGRSLLVDWWGAILALAGLGVLAARRIGPATAERFDAWLLMLPLIGSGVILVQLERFTRSLGTLLANGQELPVALAISRQTLTNRRMAAAMASSLALVREGQSLERTLAHVPRIPSFTLDLVRVGEESGQLGELLLRHADICENRLRHRIDRGLAMLVPAVTIFFGFIVAGLVATMIIAILAINDLAI
jgi:general secretion pathway protein F